MREDQTVVFEEEEDEEEVFLRPFSSFIIYFLISCDQNIDGGSSALSSTPAEYRAVFVVSECVCRDGRPRPGNIKLETWCSPR